VITEISVDAFVPPGLVAQLDEGAARAVVRDIAAAARAKWISLAGEHLRRTEQDYTRGIQPVVFGQGGIIVASITLLGAWPNMLEAGFPPFDMRTTLLGSSVPIVPRGQRGKHAAKGGGFYRTIAFRMTGPSSTGRNAQRVTDVYAKQLGAERAKKLGRVAWKAMGDLNKNPSTSNPGEKTRHGARLKTEGTVLDVRGHSHKLITAADGSTSIIRHGGRQHAVPLFEGAMKHAQTYARATQAFTGTMRTISTNQPEGWIHPGFHGAHLVPEVTHYINRVGPDMVAATMERISEKPRV
jgi:hypothetical protein